MMDSFKARLSSYCGRCRAFWSARPQSEHPSHWIDGTRYFPELKEQPDGKDQTPKVEFPNESTAKYRRMHDHGPQYGSPRYGEEKDEPDEQAVAPHDSVKSMAKQTVHEFDPWVERTLRQAVNVSFVSNFDNDVPRNWEDEGPRKGEPRFTVEALPPDLDEKVKAEDKPQLPPATTVGSEKEETPSSTGPRKLFCGYTTH